MGNNRVRYATAPKASPSITAHLELLWDPRVKVWHIMALDGSGRVVARDSADSSVELDRHTLGQLVSSVRDRLEALLF